MTEGKGKPRRAATLSPRAKRFVEQYLKLGGNGNAAVRAAGYKAGTDSSASATASRLLRNAAVQRELDRRKAQIEARLEAQTDSCRLGRRSMRQRKLRRRQSLVAEEQLD